MTFISSLEPLLQQRQQQGLYRQRRTLASPQGASVTIDGQPLINFSSNDYLGLASHPKLIEAAQFATQRWGYGSGASHLVCGHSEEHHRLEQALADFTGRDRALLFSTGYMANLATIQALVSKGDGVFEDKLNHASLLDGGLISGARFQRFLHNNSQQLERKLQVSDAARKLVVVDGVYSMDGDLAPLPELAAIATRHQAGLMVDDAHGFGVLGENGRGVAEHFQLDQQQLPVLMATFGKALGCFGAFVAGSETLIEYLIQFARPYIYTTALPPSCAAVANQALILLQQEPERRQHLQQLIARFRLGAASLGLALLDSPTAIQAVILGSAQTCMDTAEALRQRGILVGAIRPPTVAANSARLRITLNASHSNEQLDQLLETLDQYCPRPEV